MHSIFWMMVFTLLSLGGYAWAQDTINAGTSPEWIYTVLAGTVVPFVAALLNRQSFSSTLKGWIVVGLCLVGATLQQWYAGAFSGGFEGESFFAAMVAVAATSQIIHRLFGTAFNKIEVTTEPEAKATFVPVYDTTPIGSKDAGKAAVGAVKDEALEQAAALFEARTGIPIGTLFLGNAAVPALSVAAELDDLDLLQAADEGDAEIIDKDNAE